MQTDRFKDYRHLNDWFEEFRLYDRKDGKAVKEHDDRLSATRYAIMMLRYARTDVPPKPRSIRSSRGGWMAA
jgi:Terminase RNaseH-like domain